MKKRILITMGLLCLSSIGFSQINAKLMRYPDVSKNQIVFVFGGDLWVMSKASGTATQITHSPGEESWPRFSPDGSAIAYTASYNGNPDIYVMPSAGGVPVRVTYSSFTDRMVEWHPDGERLLFASARESGRQSYNQFYLVNKDGGQPEKLPIPYGELASFSPDGKHLAYITKITENYPFKRYRGGLTSDILLYDLDSNSVVNITERHANDGKPTWSGKNVFFLSDEGENMRLNLWKYDTQSKKISQITHFKDFDVSFLSAGPEDLIFEMGGTLYLMPLDTEKYQPITINVVSDLSVEMPRRKNVSKMIQNASPSPSGKRVIFEARGELFNAPVKEGFVLNTTQSSGAYDRDPSWSPDGKSIAYWSDKSGENEIYIQSIDGTGNDRKLTNRNLGYGYHLYWSPNSKNLAFIDETNHIFIVNTTSGETTTVDHTNWNISHSGRPGYSISWSSDSQWITYQKGLDNANTAIFLYNLAKEKVHQITSGFYNDSDPIFSFDGKYLFYLTNRNMSVAYSDMGDGTWIYPNSTQIAALSLAVKTPSLLEPKNDEVDLEKKDEKSEESPKDKKKKKKSKKDKKESEPKVEPIQIDLARMESRLTILPSKSGNLSNLISMKGKLVYLRSPNTGSAGESSTLQFFDFKEREDKTIISDVNFAVSTGDGKSLLIRQKRRFGIIKPSEKQKIKDPIPTNGLVMNWVPKEEWRQIFSDTWRRYRDFFYDPDMHHVDWDGLKKRYGALIEDARTRWDVVNIQSNLLAELSAGHTYSRAGDVETVTRSSTGFLGIDWKLVDNTYRIKKIIQPAIWDTEVRSPFDKPGVDFNVGDTILAVNGMALDPKKDPYAMFEGLAGKTVTLSLSKSGQTADPKSITIQCLSQRQEITLRYLAWIESNRKMIDRLSDGKLGYIYMSNTAGRGQLELVRMFYGQLDKQGFIIDERFNGGGQLADRFLELLQRPVVYNLHWRHGRDHTFPIKTNPGPMGMLINGWAGSGGDGLPWAFQELKAGPIVGERTLGILVGPATGHRLIDGGGITVPGARLYDNDGHWFWEGQGVAPDTEVWDDPNIQMQGRDPQIERVVEEVMELLKTESFTPTPAPAREDRTAKGLNP